MCVCVCVCLIRPSGQRAFGSHQHPVTAATQRDRQAWAGLDPPSPNIRSQDTDPHGAGSVFWSLWVPVGPCGSLLESSCVFKHTCCNSGVETSCLHMKYSPCGDKLQCGMYTAMYMYTVGVHCCVHYTQKCKYMSTHMLKSSQVSHRGGKHVSLKLNRTN